MDALVTKHERYLDAMMDAADALSAATEAEVESQTTYNWCDIARDPANASKLVWDWIDDPTAYLAEIYREFSMHRRPNFSDTNFAEFGLFVARILERRMDDISRTQVEERQ